MIRCINDNDINYIIEKMKYFGVLYGKSNIKHHPFNKYLVYEDNNELIGFLEYALCYDRLELNYIFVNDEYRRRGIGEKLLKYLLNMYKELDNITLEVSEKNTCAINLYEKLNFKKVSIREKYYSNGENAIFMMRGL